MLKHPSADNRSAKIRSISIQVKPAVLVWARESLGRTANETADHLGISEELLKQWEAGEAQPMLHQLKALARYYRRPLAAFFLPSPPPETPLPRDFRTLPGGNLNPLSPKTRLAMRQARRLQAIASELREEQKADLIAHLGGIKVTDDPEEVASRVREALVVSEIEQLSWKNDTDAMERWKKAVESLGVLVFQMPTPLEEARAFSLTDGGRPVIVISSKDTVRGRIFSLFHELGHILLNVGGICDPGYDGVDEVLQRNRSVEAFCNFFSGAVLVPIKSLLGHRSVKGKAEPIDWPERTLGTISNDFKVSKEVILRRLMIAGLATRQFYRIKHNEWIQKETKAESIKRVKRDIPKECLQRNGLSLTSLVLDSYRNDRITTSDVADYLGIRVKHIPRVEKLIEAQI